MTPRQVLEAKAKELEETLQDWCPDELFLGADQKLVVVIRVVKTSPSRTTRAPRTSAKWGSTLSPEDWVKVKSALASSSSSLRYAEVFEKSGNRPQLARRLFPNSSSPVERINSLLRAAGLLIGLRNGPEDWGMAWPGRKIKFCHLE